MPNKAKVKPVKGQINPNEAQTSRSHMRTRDPGIQPQQQIKVNQSFHIQMIQIKPHQASSCRHSNMLAWNHNNNPVKAGSTINHPQRLRNVSPAGHITCKRN